jgi:hypothetical protein
MGDRKLRNYIGDHPDLDRSFRRGGGQFGQFSDCGDSQAGGGFYGGGSGGGQNLPARPGSSAGRPGSAMGRTRYAGGAHVHHMRQTENVELMSAG